MILVIQICQRLEIQFPVISFAEVFHLNSVEEKPMLFNYQNFFLSREKEREREEEREKEREIEKVCVCVCVCM